MTSQDDQTIYLSRYQPPAFLVNHVSLEFVLHPTATRVRSTIKFQKNPESPATEFFLHGEELTLISAMIDGAAVTPEVTPQGLTCDVPSDAFTWQAEVEINPSSNSALSGLYMSNGIFCTQCEAEGFRRITFYPDRPDVMATFDVAIETDLTHALSNGEPLGQQGIVTRWRDPWPKPAYLFALVSGEFEVFSDKFKTASGKPVDLNIYVRDGDRTKCGFAMQSLKTSMTWDEEVYGREYDLSVFNIVAVDDFNMGAMENKGLNIFNSSAVLASPETSVDANFERIEAIIAHEYFHNWTGNRITCRDWFQLSLKEGLTVFRDQQFSADIRGADVCRIADVEALRGRQFREDNGPLSHPVRPESFVEINNFYTATVYEKGAELIRMMKTLVGDDAYKMALDLYFDRHDGQACTIEDWLQVFTDTTGEDFSQFKLWYSQAGTPRVTVEDSYLAGCYEITFTQTIPDTPGQSAKLPMVIPIALGFLDEDGKEVYPTKVFTLNQAKQSFRIEEFVSKPIPSLLRGFSAPVILTRETPDAERLVLMSHDTDMFNRYENARILGLETLVRMITNGTAPETSFLQAVMSILGDETLDPAFRALCCAWPSQDEIAQGLADQGHLPDPIAIHAAIKNLSYTFAITAGGYLYNIYKKHQVKGDYSPNSLDCGHRALANLALSYISYLDKGSCALSQFDSAENMTLQLPALSNLVKVGKGGKALREFYTQWEHERLVIDKWFSLQVSACNPAHAVKVTQKLLEHADFTMKNPNRFRALIGTLAMSPAAFHNSDGSAYTLVAEQLIALDDLNPQLCARMTTVFETWKRYDPSRQSMMKAALQSIANKPNLSRDTSEMVQRLLDA